MLACGQEFELQKDILERPRIPFDDSDIVYDPEYADFSDLELPEVDEKDEQQEEEPPEPPTTPPRPTDPNKTYVGTGSVYYMPVYSETRKCKKDETAYIQDVTGKKFAELCKYEVANCAMQGSCYYVNKKGIALYSWHKNVYVVNPKTKGKVRQPRFKINAASKKCPQGMGVQNICLDPYRSIAADPIFHKAGDVVFIEKLRGQELPNGETHDGYFVVRDTGGAIKGEGRFDFFIGFDDYRGHLFSKLNLADKRVSKFKYQKASANYTQQVLKNRNYPLAPDKVHKAAYKQITDLLNAQKNPVTLHVKNAFYELDWREE